MKKILKVVFLIFFCEFANADIVEKLTELNNLYKENAITKEEFSQAKSILLQTKSKNETKDKIEKVKKKKIKKEDEIKNKKVSNIKKNIIKILLKPTYHLKN